MALTVNTALISAKNRGSFVGVSLRETSKYAAEHQTFKVKRVGRQYVTFTDRLAGLEFRVHKNTITQIRAAGRTLNKA